MEWIGSELKKDWLKNEWIASPSTVENDGSGLKIEDKKYILNYTMLVSFRLKKKKKHSHTKHTIIFFHTLKHVISNMIPNTLFAL